MLLRSQGLYLDLLEQFAHGRRSRQIQTQRQGVDEEADQAFDLGPSAVGHGCADDDILLARESCQQRRPGTQQSHVERCAVTLAQMF